MAVAPKLSVPPDGSPISTVAAATGEGPSPEALLVIALATAWIVLSRRALCFRAGVPSDARYLLISDASLEMLLDWGVAARALETASGAAESPTVAIATERMMASGLRFDRGRISGIEVRPCN